MLIGLRPITNLLIDVDLLSRSQNAILVAVIELVLWPLLDKKWHGIELQNIRTNQCRVVLVIIHNDLTFPCLIGM